jgi:hypothetical protein
MFRHMPALLAGLFVPSVCLGQSLPGKHPLAPTQIDIIANDYAFMPLPKRIRPGPTIFTFANRGKVAHELSLARLKHGVAIDDVVKGVRAGGRPRDFTERSVGILIAQPAQSPDGRLLVDLRAGETYLLFCNLKDTPEAPGHLMLGMYTSFRP